MAEEGENWDDYSENDSVFVLLRNLSIHKTQTRNSDDHNSEGRVPTGRDVAVTLPCGHRRPAHYIIACFKYYIKQGQTEFTCPEVKQRTCGAKLSYQDICRLIVLTSQQRGFLEENLGLLTAERLCTFKAVSCFSTTERNNQKFLTGIVYQKNQMTRSSVSPFTFSVLDLWVNHPFKCPGCKSFVERRDESNLCVHCTICTASQKHTYTFCWSCRSEWKGPVHSCRDDRGLEAITGDCLVPCEPAFKQKKLLKRDDIYPMKDKSIDRKRLALLINNVEFEYVNDRVGADQDELSMERLLTGLGYSVVTLRDLTAQGMRAAMRDFAQREEHSQSDSCFVVFMSHGDATGICGVSSIVNSDGVEDTFSIDEIFNCLNTPNCAGLRDKPKIILVQSCRGGNVGCVDVPDGVPKTEHTEKDFCCLRSSTPDTVSFRHPERGSAFIRAIVEIFNRHAYEDDIEELFRKVLKKFKDNHPRQMPCKDRTTLSKKFYLFPGL